jgi:hypothetical protein
MQKLSFLNHTLDKAQITAVDFSISDLFILLFAYLSPETFTFFANFVFKLFDKKFVIFSESAIAFYLHRIIIINW